MKIDDPSRVNALLSIVAGIANDHPQFMAISSAASRELKELNLKIADDDAKGKTSDANSGQPTSLTAENTAKNTGAYEPKNDPYNPERPRLGFDGQLLERTPRNRALETASVVDRRI